MYESPIAKIYGEIQDEIIKQDEERLMYLVNQSVGYQVDKGELIKALRYDRDQYRKGYLDCKIDMVDKVKQAREEMNKLASHKVRPISFDQAVAIDMCIAIIDKLIAESEE